MLNIKKDDRFLALKDIEAGGLIHWDRPFTSGFKCIVPKGTILVVPYQPPPAAEGFYCLPENEKEFEQKFVPEEDRTASGYGGFHLVLFKSLVGLSLQKL